jgi:single-stranded DNA-binding protein
MYCGTKTCVSDLAETLVTARAEQEPDSTKSWLHAFGFWSHAVVVWTEDNGGDPAITAPRRPSDFDAAAKFHGTVHELPTRTPIDPGREPEMLEGRAVLSLATKTSWLPKDSDKWQSRTDWHRIVAWTPLAEAVRTLAKGDHVIVEGELRSSEYEREVRVNGGDIVTVTTKTWEIRARAIGSSSPPSRHPSLPPLSPDGTLATPAPHNGESGFSFARFFKIIPFPSPTSVFGRPHSSMVYVPLSRDFDERANGASH